MVVLPCARYFFLAARFPNESRWLPKRLSRFHFVIRRAALALVFAWSSCGSCAAFWFYEYGRIRPYSVPVFWVWLATACCSLVCAWCCRAFFAAFVLSFVVSSRGRVGLFFWFCVFGGAGAALVFYFCGAARLQVFGGGSGARFRRFQQHGREHTNTRQNKALHPTAYSLRYASFLGFAPASGGG